MANPGTPMDPLALTDDDYKIFALDGFEARMGAMRTSLRPKLEQLAARLCPAVSDLVGHAMFVHVAKHARRTVHAPPETWAAFALRPRGYKAVPHLALCVSKTGPHARLVLKDEAVEARAKLAGRLPRAKGLLPALKAAHATDYSHWDATAARAGDGLSEEGWRSIAHQMKLKTGHFDVGIALDGWRGDDAVIEAFRALAPLYAVTVKDLVR